MEVAILNCAGDTGLIDATDSVFSKDLRSVLLHHSFEPPSDFELFNFSFDGCRSIDVDVLIRMARTNIMKLSSSMIDSLSIRTHSSFFNLRESVTKLMMILRSNCHDLG